MRSDPLHIDVAPGQSVGETVLRLTGPLTLENLSQFQKIWREQSSPNITVDLSAVPYVDSSGIASLVNLHVSRQKVGGQVLLTGICERVRAVLVVTKVDKVLTIVSKPDALSA